MGIIMIETIDFDRLKSTESVNILKEHISKIYIQLDTYRYIYKQY